MLKKTSMLERAETLAEKSDKSIDTINSFLRDLDAKRRDIEKSLRDLDAIRGENRTIQALYDETMSRREEALVVKRNVEDALKKVKDIDSLIQIIQQQQNKVDNVKSLLVETLNMYDEIRKKVEDLEGKKETINTILSSMDDTGENLHGMNDKIVSLDEKVGMMNKLAKRIEDDIRSAQTNINRLFTDQERMSKTADRVADIESLLIHIEEEEKKVQRMRDWTARMLTELERIKDIEDGMAEISGRKPQIEVGRQGDDSTIGNILQLRRQGWTIDNIAKTLKLSKAYVELILETNEQ